MASNNDSDDFSRLDTSVPTVEGVEENENFSNRVLRAHELSEEILCMSGRDITTADHSQMHLEVHKAATNILGQPDWATKMLELMTTQHAELMTKMDSQHNELVTKMDSLKTKMESQKTTMESQQTTMESQQTKMESLTSSMGSLATVKSTAKAVGRNISIRDGDNQSMQSFLASKRT
jgi:ABC-type phosphate transport system auxiliary subunit